MLSRLGGRPPQLIWIAATDMLSFARLPRAVLCSFGTNLIRRRRTMKTSAVSSVIVLATCSLPAGCASIISGRNADVAIDSYPSNAHVIIHDNDGRQVASLNTPGVVSLKRNRRYFLPAQYTATIEAPGYAPAEVPIRSTMNPWVVGNIVIGGIPGLIVDNATGAVWKPKQSEIHSQLAPLSGPDQGTTYSASPPAPQGSAQPPQYVADRSGQAAAAAANQPQTLPPSAKY